MLKAIGLDWPDPDIKRMVWETIGAGHLAFFRIRITITQSGCPGCTCFSTLLHEKANTVNASPIESLIALRLAVGYLGEQRQAGWWRCSFLSPEGRSFLTYAFVKTRSLAQYSGVTAAAARVHDERIGVGQHVYHLFRLPEALEQAAFRAMNDKGLVAQLVAVAADRDAAMDYLTAGTAPVAPNPAGDDMVGPTWVGATQGVYSASAWGRVAALYLHGFRTGTSVFPYFADRSP